VHERPRSADRCAHCNPAALAPRGRRCRAPPQPAARFSARRARRARAGWGGGAAATLVLAGTYAPALELLLLRRGRGARGAELLPLGRIPLAGDPGRGALARDGGPAGHVTPVAESLLLLPGRRSACTAAEAGGAGAVLVRAVLRHSPLCLDA